MKLVADSARGVGESFPIRPAFRDVLQRPEEIDRRVSPRIRDLIEEFNSREVSLCVGFAVFWDPRAIKQGEHDRSHRPTDMLERILGFFKNVVHELRVFELLRPQVFLHAVLCEKSVNCFSSMFPDGILHILENHIKAVGDTLD